MLPTLETTPVGTPVATPVSTLLVTLLGAESTGKSALAAALSLHYCSQGFRATKVDEYLRQWCTDAARTPRPDEQAGIAQEQTLRIEAAVRACTPDSNAASLLPALPSHRAAAHAHAIVVADTSALMVAVYSDYLFNDQSLYPSALKALAKSDHILLMGLDVAWVADGLQRDGGHVRAPVDALIRAALTGARLQFSTIYGLGGQRLLHALQCINTTKLIAINDHMALTLPENSVKMKSQAWKWVCDKCSDPVCEHQLFSQLIGARQGLPP